MPSFDTLPAEILLSIARVIGGDYLRADIERLLLCKAWYQVAQFVAFENLTLSIESVQRFLVAPKRSQLRVIEGVRELSIEGQNYHERNSRFQATTSSDHLVSETEAGNDHQHVQIGAPRFRTVNERGMFLAFQSCGSLVSFAGYFEHMIELKTFRLRVFAKWLEHLMDGLLGLAIFSVVRSLPSSIVSLTIDNPSQRGDPRRGPETFHLCHLLSDPTILPSLRHLRLRLRSICPAIFDIMNGAEHFTKLETLIINLLLNQPGLFKGPPLVESVAHHSEYCQGPDTVKRSLFPEFFDAAKATVARLPAIRTFRILHWKFPQLQVASYDILTNRQMLLPENARWDDLDWVGEEFTEADDDQSDVDLFDESDFDTDSSYEP